MRWLFIFFATCVACLVAVNSPARNNTDASEDDFQRMAGHDVMSGWTVVNEGTLKGPSAWFISKGVITQSGNLYGGNNQRDSIRKPGTYALNGDIGWADYSMKIEMQSRDDDAIGIMFRYRDAKNYYRFSMDRQRAYRRLVKNVNGVMTVLAEDNVPYQSNTWYAVTAKVTGPRLEIYMDGKLLFGVTDESLKSGRIGLYSWGNAGSDFRNLLMTLHSGWIIVDEGDKEGPSMWSVKDGVIRQSTNISGGDDARETLYKPGTYLVNGDESWADYELNVDLRSMDDDAIGAMFRYRDPENYYLFVMDRERQCRRLLKKADGEMVLLAEDSVPYDQATWYTLTIRAMGPKISVDLSDSPVFEVEDNSHRSGKVCLYCWGNEGSEFKNLSVTPLDTYAESPEKTPEPAPATVSPDTPPSPGETNGGDVALTTDDTDDTDNYVEVVAEDYFGQDYLDFLTTGHGEAAGEDPQGKASLPPSDVKQSNALPAEGEGDDFLARLGLQVIDDGAYDRPSVWILKDNIVHQNSNIYGGSDLAVSPVKPGTHLISGDPGWTDYVFSGKMMSEDDDAIGVMFRYKDNDNYYRFSMDSERGYRRLIKKSDGYVITIAEDAFVYEPGRWYSFTITVAGSHIKIHLDGQPVVDVRDSSISSGQIGRYCWGNEGAAFTAFRVVPAGGKPVVDLPESVDSPSKVSDCQRLSVLENHLKQLEKEVNAFKQTCKCNQ